MLSFALNLTGPTLRCSRYTSEEHRLATVQIKDLTVDEHFGVRFRRMKCVKENNPSQGWVIFFGDLTGNRTRIVRMRT